MIQEFVDKFNACKSELEARFRQEHPKEYVDIVKAVIQILNDPDGYKRPDPKRIHKIDDGNYQGTLVFVIGDTGYQPSEYWYVKVDYGSCSGCDTLENIRSQGRWNEKPTEEQVKDYMTLALHIVQGLKRMGGEE